MEKRALIAGEYGHLLLFDGVCNLCNSYVQFVIERDPKAQFIFAPLQSEVGEEVMKKNDLSTEALSTVMLLKNGRLYTESDVALEVTKELSGLWSVFYVFKIVPGFIRNPIYRWIAKNRYRWFGKKAVCMVPTEALKARFYT